MFLEQLEALEARQRKIESPYDFDSQYFRLGIDTILSIVQLFSYEEKG